MRAVLISTYDLGRQSFGLASGAAALRDGGADVRCVDLSRERFDPALIAGTDVVAFFLPMHTATRLALPVMDRVRAIHPAVTIGAYGLYAPLNAPLLRAHGASWILGGEFEDGLRALAAGIDRRDDDAGAVPRVTFRAPIRDGLPPLASYATLQLGEERRVVGYTEASRGCKHRCRHCPIVPVYDGRFRVVPADIVLQDIAAQVEAGARHVTFGDPDFFNGIRHAAGIVRAVAARFPGVTYDVTIKVEHLLEHRAWLPVLAETGCAFVTTAVESFDDEVLGRLQKGHTHDGFVEALGLARAAGLVLSPTFVAFTPWTTLESYCAFLAEIDRLGLVRHVAPIQLAIRLLVTSGSRLLELPEVRAAAGPFDGSTLTHPWRSPHPGVDALQTAVAALVGSRASAELPREKVFETILCLAHQHAGVAVPERQDPDILPRAAVPYLNEPWYC